jgi:hypothetical protein
VTRKITVPVSELTFAALARLARDTGQGETPETIAEDWLAHRARESIDLQRRFEKARAVVHRLLFGDRENG